MTVNEAVKAWRESKPIIMNTPTCKDIEYERILCVDKGGGVLLKDKCGHSTTMTDIGYIRVKE